MIMEETHVDNREIVVESSTLAYFKYSRCLLLKSHILQELTVVMSTQLSTLATIISSGVQTLESAYARDGQTFPSLDDPFEPRSLDQDLALLETRRLIVAAAAQIIASVRMPAETILESTLGVCMTSTLGFVVDVNVVDILKEAAPNVRS
jgi:hypothetical protein